MWKPKPAENEIKAVKNLSPLTFGQAGLTSSQNKMCISIKQNWNMHWIGNGTVAVLYETASGSTSFSVTKE